MLKVFANLFLVDKTIIIKSSPQAFELFGVKNVPKDLVGGKRQEKGFSEDLGSSGKSPTNLTSINSIIFPLKKNPIHLETQNLSLYLFGDITICQCHSACEVAFTKHA